MAGLSRCFLALVALYMIVLFALALSDVIAPNLRWFDWMFTWQGQLVVWLCFGTGATFSRNPTGEHLAHGSSRAPGNLIVGKRP